MKTLLVPIGLAIIVAIGLGIYWYHSTNQQEESPMPAMSESTKAPQTMLPDDLSIPGQRAYYINDKFQFRFETPKGFFVEEYGVRDPDPQVLVRGPKGDNLMLVWMTPLAPGITEVSADLIMKVDPTLAIASALTPIIVGDSGNGVFFDTKSQTWEDGHHYWFIYEETLYRVSTAKQLEYEAVAVLSTWLFLE